MNADLKSAKISGTDVLYSNYPGSNGNIPVARSSNLYNSSTADFPHVNVGGLVFTVDLGSGTGADAPIGTVFTFPIQARMADSSIIDLYTKSEAAIAAEAKANLGSASDTAAMAAEMARIRSISRRLTIEAELVGWIAQPGASFGFGGGFLVGSRLTSGPNSFLKPVFKIVSKPLRGTNANSATYKSAPENAVVTDYGSWIPRSLVRADGVRDASWWLEITVVPATVVSTGVFDDVLIHTEAPAGNLRGLRFVLHLANPTVSPDKDNLIRVALDKSTFKTETVEVEVRDDYGNPVKVTGPDGKEKNLTEMKTVVTETKTRFSVNCSVYRFEYVTDPRYTRQVRMPLVEIVDSLAYETGTMISVPAQTITVLPNQSVTAEYWPLTPKQAATVDPETAYYRLTVNSSTKAYTLAPYNYF